MSESRASWLDQTQKVGAVVALAGIFIFGVLMLAYGQFYRELGVSLNDAGVEYGKALGGVAGLTIVLLVSTMLVAGVVWIAATLKGGSVEFLPTLYCTFILLALAAAVALPVIANSRADAVKTGKPVESVRIPVIGVEILATRAAPADVQLIQSEEGTKLAQSLGALRPPLFYIGQGRGEIVLYDQPAQQAIFVPSNLVGLLEVRNCETKRSDKKICGGVKK